MQAQKIFETVLYVDDFSRAKWFYHDVLGLKLLSEFPVGLAFGLSDSVLLLFNPNLSSAAGRDVPAHGGHGPGHVAFQSTASELAQWEKHFTDHGIAIEQRQRWDSGGESLYVRDPAGNSIEFAPATLWGGGWKF